MTSYRDILDAADASESGDAVQRIKQLAAKTLHDADSDMRLLATEHFNHSYLPDFVMRWPNRPERFVFLRASAYADEIRDDVVRLADHHPIFVQLSEFRPFNDEPLRESLESLSQSAGERKSLVASVPAIGLLDDSPRTGKMLSSFVMRGGKGVIEDSEVETLAETVESGFDGAMKADRIRTADALAAVDNVLDPASSMEFTHLFEAAWISSGASAVEFPGGVTSIGENLSANLLSRMLEIVPESLSDFWEQIGKAITLESFSEQNLIGDQPRLQIMMKNAVKSLVSNRYVMRRTFRSDQEVDPFIWQVERGILSLRGGGHQAWIGSSSLPPSITGDSKNEHYSVDEPPSLSALSARSEAAALTLTDISVRDSAGIAVRFTSPGDGNVATSALVERVSAGVGTLVQVNDVEARISGKAVPIDYARSVAGPRTNSKVPVAGLIWNAWNLLAETDEQVRAELQQVLRLAEDDAGRETSAESDGEPTESTD